MCRLFCGGTSGLARNARALARFSHNCSCPSACLRAGGRGAS